MMTTEQTQLPLEMATFAAGCFWGIEAAFAKVPGVVSTQVGYMGGWLPHPTYQQVCTDETGHAEVVQLTFNPAQIPYDKLLAGFWQIHDPTTLDRQGPDRGHQYRSAIFYHSPEQHRLAYQTKQALQASGQFGNRLIVTQISPATAFYPAEAYHQQYFAKHGARCHLPVIQV